MFVVHINSTNVSKVRYPILALSSDACDGDFFGELRCLRAGVVDCDDRQLFLVRDSMRSRHPRITTRGDELFSN